MVHRLSALGICLLLSQICCLERHKSGCTNSTLLVQIKPRQDDVQKCENFFQAAVLALCGAIRKHPLSRLMIFGHIAISPKRLVLNTVTTAQLYFGWG